MTRFVVTGMPRARTAWVANFLTYGGCYCEHDGLARAGNVERCVDWFNTVGGYDAIGISDSGAAQFTRALDAGVPGLRWVVIVRAPRECEASFAAAGCPAVSLDHHARRVAVLASRPDTLVVRFEELDERIDEIARFCCPTWKPNPDRRDMLCRLNIQLTPTGLSEGARLALLGGLVRQVELE